MAQYDYYNSLFDGRNSFSKTDTDATFMHMKEDHMRNGHCDKVRRSPGRDLMKVGIAFSETVWYNFEVRAGTRLAHVDSN